MKCHILSTILSTIGYLSHNSRGLAYRLVPSGDACVFSLNKDISVSCGYLGLPEYSQK